MKNILDRTDRIRINERRRLRETRVLNHAPESAANSRQVVNAMNKVPNLPGTQIQTAVFPALTEVRHGQRVEFSPTIINSQTLNRPGGPKS
jgi:hypothetical protein